MNEYFVIYQPNEYEDSHYLKVTAKGRLEAFAKCRKILLKKLMDNNKNELTKVRVIRAIDLDKEGDLIWTQI
jgi:ssDNA-specific exonuclease RecJ